MVPYAASPTPTKLRNKTRPARSVANPARNVAKDQMVIPKDFEIMYILQRIVHYGCYLNYIPTNTIRLSYRFLSAIHANTTAKIIYVKTIPVAGLLRSNKIYE